MAGTGLVGVIARKEARELLRDGRFRWGAALVCCLLAVALLSGWQHYSAVSASHTAAAEESWDRWLAQGEKNPHSAAHYGVYAFKPMTPLSLVDQGVNAYTGVFTWLEAHNQNPFEYQPAKDGPALGRFGQLTAAGVLQLLLPLLIILLGFGAVAGEREAGTLRLLLSAGVKRETLAVGKAAGLAIGLGTLLVPAAAAGAFALVAGADVDQGVSPGRVAVLACSYLLYFAVVLGITLAVSAWTRASNVALVALLGFWVVNALVAPRVGSDLARAQLPLPSATEFRAAINADLQNGVDGHSPQDVRQASLRDSVLQAYGVDSIEALPVNYAGISLQAGENHANEVYDRHFGNLTARLLQQESLHRTLGLLAPMMAVRSLSMGLSGTDVYHHEQFVRASEEHRRTMQRILNGDIERNSRFGERYIAGPEVWASVPEFRYEAPALGTVVGRERQSFAILLLWTLVAGALFLVGVRRVTPA